MTVSGAALKSAAVVWASTALTEAKNARAWEEIQACRIREEERIFRP